MQIKIKNKLNGDFNEILNLPLPYNFQIKQEGKRKFNQNPIVIQFFRKMKKFKNFIKAIFEYGIEFEWDIKWTRLKLKGRIVIYFWWIATWIIIYFIMKND